MPDITTIKEWTKRVTVNWGEFEVNVWYRPAAVTPRFQQRFEEIRALKDEGEAWYELLRPVFSKWDITEEGKMLELTPDVCGDVVPIDLLATINEAIYTSLRPNPTSADNSTATS